MEIKMENNYWHIFHVHYEKQVKLGKPIFRNEIQEVEVLGFTEIPSLANELQATFELEQKAKKAKWTVFKITKVVLVRSRKFNFPTNNQRQ